MNRKDTLEYLLNKSGGKCMSCGRALSREDAVIEHIFPIRYGGSDRIENLKVLCHSCNCAFACRPFREVEFQQYLQKMLSGDPRFKKVCIDQRIRMADGRQDSVRHPAAAALSGSVSLCTVYSCGSCLLNGEISSACPGRRVYALGRQSAPNGHTGCTAVLPQGAGSI